MAYTLRKRNNPAAEATKMIEKAVKSIRKAKRSAKRPARRTSSGRIPSPFVRGCASKGRVLRRNQRSYKKLGEKIRELEKEYTECSTSAKMPVSLMRALRKVANKNKF